MTDKWLLIESRDQFGSNDTTSFLELAVNLSTAGNEVSVFLVQNGALMARAGAQAAAMQRLCESSVMVVADEFSARERGIAAQVVRRGIELVPLDFVVDRLADGWKTIWH